MPKPKRVNKSSEQVAAEMRQIQEVKRQRALTKDVIFPLLVKGSTSISNAQQMIQVLSMSIRQAFNAQMKDLKVADLKVKEKIDPKVNQADYYCELLTVLEGERLTDVINLLEGIENEIARLIKKETSERKLETLKTDFID